LHFKFQALQEQITFAPHKLSPPLFGRGGDFSLYAVLITCFCVEAGNLKPHFMRYHILSQFAFQISGFAGADNFRTAQAIPPSIWERGPGNGANITY